jgi:SAM-dependent methyltransferase
VSDSTREGLALSKDFSARAEAYKNFRPQYPERLFDFIAEEASARRLAWDCGCGNGQSTLPLGDRFERVIATDISIAQLKQSWRHPHTTYLATAAEAAAIAPQRADAIVVTQAVHWFTFDRFYTEVRRIARPGGLLVLVGYGLLSVDPAVDSILKRFYFDVVGAFWPPERRLLDQEYKTIPFPFPEIAAPIFEIRLDWQFAEMMGYLSTWTAVENYRRHNGKDPLPALSAELEPHWKNAQTVRWPLYIRAGRVDP